MKVREALADAAQRLTTVGGVPRLDAELLMASALGVTIGEMMLSHLDRAAPDGFDGLVLRRLAHEPMGYVLGRVGFWTIELDIGPGVLIPRADSESLIEAAVAYFGRGGPASVLDLGTGPGSLLLAALAQWPAAEGIGVDSSTAALEYARRNAARLRLEERARFAHGDWAAGLDGRFDLILCNPPYVAASALIPDVADWEPAEALFGGEDGLDAYRTLAPQIAERLAPGGIACVEICASQAQAVAELFCAQGLRATPRKDLGGRDRCLVLRR